MFAKFHWRSLTLGLVALALAGVASTASATHSWNGYHWARTSPDYSFTLKLGNNLSSTWTSFLNQASSDWSSSDVLNTTVVAGQAKGRCRATAGRVEVCNSTYGNNGWLGIASIWITDGTHITQGTVKLNDSYFNTATYNTPAWRALVTCQEIGHTFGLDHQSTDGSSLNTCMDYYHNTSASDTKSTHPNQHDYDELVTIYTHKDSFTTVGSVPAGKLPAAVANADVSTPAQWGKLVKQSRDGRSAIYERDFGRGNKVVTFVIWAK